MTHQNLTDHGMGVPGAVHPIVAAASSMQDALAGMAEVDPMWMPTPDKATALARLRRLVGSVSELYLRVLANSDELASESGARDVAAWLAATEQVDPRTARAELGLAESLLKFPQVAAAMAHGQVSVEQARVIVRTLEALPEDLAAATDPANPESVDAEVDVESVLGQAETEMVRLAGKFRPSELTRLGKHLLNVVAPEVADAAEEAALRNAEKKAKEKTSLSLKKNGDGSTRITGTIADALAERLRTYLEAFAQPRLAALSADGKRMPTHKLHGLAFGDLLERIDPTTLPDHGGDATTVMVLLDYEYLIRHTWMSGTTSEWATQGTGSHTRYAAGADAAADSTSDTAASRPGGASPGANGAGGAGARAGSEAGAEAGATAAADDTDAAAAGAPTDTRRVEEALARAAATLGDTPISAAEARRLACQAKIIPVVLDGQSQPLDLGRAKRLFSPAQRKAIRVRDGGCQAEGCTARASWCDIHVRREALIDRVGVRDLHRCLVVAGW